MNLNGFLSLDDIAHRRIRGAQAAHAPADDEPAQEPVLLPLTAREREVLHGMAAGMSNLEIADQLLISERTVRTHVTNLLAKLYARNRTDAVRIGSLAGLIDATVVHAYAGAKVQPPYRDGETEPPAIAGFFWALFKDSEAVEPVRIATSPWGEWRMARLGHAREPYLPHRLREAGVRWWGPVTAPCDAPSDAGETAAAAAPLLKRRHLTAADVMEIRRLRASGVTLAELAKAFRTTVPNVSNIATRKTWRQIP